MNITVNRPVQSVQRPTQGGTSTPRFGENPTPSTENDSAQIWGMIKSIALRLGVMAAVGIGTVSVLSTLYKNPQQPVKPTTDVQAPATPAPKMADITGTIGFNAMHLNGNPPMDVAVKAIKDVYLTTPDGKIYILEDLSFNALITLYRAKHKDNITFTGEVGQEEKTIQGFHTEIKGFPLKVHSYLLNIQDRLE